MATPELISLIVALVVWIALLGTLAPEPSASTWSMATCSTQLR
jgi:hypothetical protein